MDRRDQLTPSESQDVKAFLDKGIKIPVQPKVLLEIDALADQPHVNIKAVSGLISRDAGIVSALFKIVNSPAFSLTKKVDSLDSAISVLGLQQVITLVKCIGLRQAIGGNAPFYEKFWERSSDIAQLSTVIAKSQESVCNIVPSQAYMAGLFYECGVPLLMQRFPEYCAAFRLAHGGWPSLTEEDVLFHTDHAIVGYLISRYWHLPKFIGQAIRHHHTINQTNSAARTMVSILQMAVHLYNLHHRQKDEIEWADAKPTVLLELGLHMEGLQEFEEDILELFTEASS